MTYYPVFAHVTRESGTIVFKQCHSQTADVIAEPATLEFKETVWVPVCGTVHHMFVDIAM